MTMSDCAVCVGGSSGYEIEDYYRAIRTAKRNYHCCECGRLIVAGSEHEKSGGTNVDEGGRVHFVTCLDCANIAEGLSCERRVHAVLWDDLEESGGFDEFSEACVAKVATVSAKKYLRDRWLKWKGLAV